MRGIIRPLITKFRPSTRRSGPGIQTAAIGEQAVLRRLLQAFDRAMELGLWEHAERLAQSCSRLAPSSPRTAERLARLRLAQGDPETALNIIDGSRQLHDSARILRIACLLRLGRRSEAHSDLLRWSRRSTSPIDARILLALLEWGDGDDNAATLALLRNLRHLEDPQTLQLLLLIAVASGRRAQVQRWSERLRQCCAFGGDVPYLPTLLSSLHLCPSVEQCEASEEQIRMLSIELLGAEQTIPSLVEALRLQPHRPSIELLYEAVRIARIELVDQARALESMACLAIMLDRRPEALRWAEEALLHNPMSAPLRMLVSRIRHAHPQPQTPDHPRMLENAA